MDGNSSSDWNEDIEVGSFGDLLECMNTQFITNQGSNHYPSSFVPVSNLAWPMQQHSQPHHLLPMDTSLNTSPLGPQVGLNTLRSYSVNQTPFSDMDCGRTPLLRSSSDLGLRLNQFQQPRTNYPDCQLQEILDHHVETLDSSAFYPENSHLQPPNSSPYQHIPVSKCDEMMSNQNAGMHYASYIADSDMLQNEQQANNFSTKLSNFTASLGTWLSPLDQIRSDYNHSVQVSDSSAHLSMLQENIQDNAQISSTIDSQVSETLSSSFPDIKPVTNTKPRYSDVLSKAPTQEGKSLSNCHKSVNVQINAGFKSREQPLKSNNKSSKHRSNVGMGRSNSPNLGSPVNNTNLTDSASNSKYSKFDSKVGLDDFDLPVNVPNYNSNTSGISNNNNNININNNFNGSDNNDKTRKRASITSDDSSPCHQSKKGSKFEKSLPDKLQECGVGETENLHCDKLNNHTLSTQQKQTPKRTTYINNNFASFSSGISSSKTNNTDSSSSSSTSFEKNRKTFSIPKEEELKTQFENSANSNTGKNISNTCGTPSSAVPSTAGCGSSVKSGGSNSSRSGRYVNRLERNKDNQNKRNLPNKKKKDASQYTHSDLLMTGWTLCLLWLGKAGLWLLSLIMDVAQMSYRLCIHFSLSLLEKGKVYHMEIKHAFKFYWTKVMSKLFNKKTEGKKGGRNDRKSAFGLESNIPLPITGEEAMKRLLAGRGKDPYSILGVTRDCTDDDIKKYYKRQAFLVHPDKNKQPGAEEAFKILAHAFEIIGEPERREQYNTKLAEEAHLEGATGELASLLNLLKEKLEEAANTIRCTNCNKRHRRTKLPRPVYAARHCAECQIRHAAREGDIWAESWHIGLRWKYYACMEGAIYDISEWASCQRENLKHLQANTHSVQYRIVSGKKNAGGKNSTPECPTDPELEEFFNNLCRERFGQDFVPGTNQSGPATDPRKRRGKKKK